MGRNTSIDRMLDAVGAHQRPEQSEDLAYFRKDGIRRPRPAASSAEGSRPAGSHSSGKRCRARWRRRPAVGEDSDGDHDGLGDDAVVDS
jgi:hypothetical protein